MLLGLPAASATVDGEIRRFIETGDIDPMFSVWPGDSSVDRMRSGDAAIRDARHHGRISLARERRSAPTARRRRRLALRPADVIRAAAKRGIKGYRTEGETAALAFQMFELGAGLHEIVMALNLTPGQVRELYSDFKTSLYGSQQP